MRFLFFQAVTHLILMGKNESQVFRPAGVTCDNLGGQAAVPQFLLQLRQGPLRKLIVLCQGIDEAIASVCPEPDRISCKKIRIINQVDHMAPGMAGNQECLHFDVLYEEHIPVFQQLFGIIRLYQRKLICPENDLPAYFPGQITVFNFAEVDRCLFEESGRIPLNRTDVIRVLMCNQDMLDLSRVQIQPSHLFRQAVIVITGIDHDGRAVFCIEEDIRDPLTDTGNMVVNPACIQRLEYFLAITVSHGLFL